MHDVEELRGAALVRELERLICLLRGERDCYADLEEDYGRPLAEEWFHDA